jgi:hypothetical protein
LIFFLSDLSSQRQDEKEKPVRLLAEINYFAGVQKQKSSLIKKLVQAFFFN